MQEIKKDNQMQNDSTKTECVQNLEKETQANEELNQGDGKLKHITRGANDLSLGISMILAVLIGLGIGYGLYKLLGYYWLIWVGLGYGVAAAVLNVFKAYKRLHKDLDSLKDEEKYKYMQDKILEEKELKGNKTTKHH